MDANRRSSAWSSTFGAASSFSCFGRTEERLAKTFHHLLFDIGEREVVVPAAVQYYGEEPAAPRVGLESVTKPATGLALSGALEAPEVRLGGGQGAMSPAHPHHPFGGSGHFPARSRPEPQDCSRIELFCLRLRVHRPGARTRPARPAEQGGRVTFRPTAPGKLRGEKEAAPDAGGASRASGQP